MIESEKSLTKDALLSALEKAVEELYTLEVRDSAAGLVDEDEWIQHKIDQLIKESTGEVVNRDFGGYALKMVKELTETLDDLLDVYVANRGDPEHEFITNHGDSHGRINHPWYWVRARQSYEKGKGYLERN